jgi:hypothetical protein
MEIDNLEKNNNINLENNLVNENSQKNFLQTTLGKTINTAVDIGIRTIFPEFVEEQVINIKDNLLNYGLKDGINKTINDAVDLGKSAIGIVTGNFENVSQMRSAVQSGGLIDGMSSLLDTVVNKVKEAGLINNTVASAIKQGKNIILNNIENNIENTFNKQYEALENTDKYINNWKNYFEEKNFEGMQKEYNKMEKQFKSIAPIEKTIEDVKTIKILHNLIKNNGQDFNLTQDQMELVEKLK